jgi:hypothetical protein
MLHNTALCCTTHISQLLAQQKAPAPEASLGSQVYVYAHQPLQVIDLSYMCDLQHALAKWLASARVTTPLLCCT